MASRAGIARFSDASTLWESPAGVLTLYGLIPPGGRPGGPTAPAVMAFAPLPIHRGRPAFPARGPGRDHPPWVMTRSPSRRIRVAGMRPFQCAGGRIAGRPPRQAIAGDTPPAQCGSGRRGALWGLLPAWPGLHPREEPFTCHPISLTARCTMTGRYLEFSRTKWRGTVSVHCGWPVCGAGRDRPAGARIPPAGAALVPAPRKRRVSPDATA